MDEDWGPTPSGNGKQALAKFGWCQGLRRVGRALGRLIGWEKLGESCPMGSPVQGEGDARILH